ncbi:MAG: sugar-binding domain-containing protein [Kiritimatiellia bacterium]|nr:hypothetical protein [Lentisphaerota bacterium]
MSFSNTIPLRFWSRCLSVNLLMAMIALPGTGLLAKAPADETSILEQRRVLLAAAGQGGSDNMLVLQSALDDASDLVRLTAVHLLAGMGAEGRPGLAAALRNDDPRVRRVAIAALAAQDLLPSYWSIVLLDEDPAIQREVRLIWTRQFALPRGAALESLVDELAAAYKDAEPGKRRHIIGLLDEFDEFNDSMRDLLLLAIKDQDDGVRSAAFDILRQHAKLDWPELQGLIETALADSSENVRESGRQLRWSLLQVMPPELPLQGWRFCLDPEARGRDEKWFAVDFDDSAWDEGEIGTHWHNFLDDHYIGPGWYRIEIDIPKMAKWDEAQLHFAGVDEGAWVWVNGQFVGEHDIGPEGWDKHFILDVTEQIVPGTRNQITILARNTAGGGGVWQPVWLRVMDSSRLQ